RRRRRLRVRGHLVRAGSRVSRTDRDHTVRPGQLTGISDKLGWQFQDQLSAAPEEQHWSLDICARSGGTPGREAGPGTHRQTKNTRPGGREAKIFLGSWRGENANLLPPLPGRAYLTITCSRGRPLSARLAIFRASLRDAAKGKLHAEASGC